MTNSDKFSVLHTYFGYSEFRSGQEEVIDALINQQDVVAIMPTGAGKSICYQVPALLFEGVTLVVSPLISLMKDQVNALIQAGIPAAFLNSSLSAAEQWKVIEMANQQAYKLIYVAPEQLMTPRFIAFAQQNKVSFISIDEAHCVSQWGQDFRPGYLNIHEFIDLLPTRPVVGAFTATATTLVKDDLIQRLHLTNPFVVTTGFDRKNLSFSVEKPKNKFKAVKEYVEDHEDKSGIIYCLSRKNVEDVCQQLCDLGFPATRYHAGLTSEERAHNQELFVTDEIPIMVATNAFGMGIDKSNVSYVIHYNMPKNLESYYQEAGRAGRDGSPAECILLYGGRDVVTNQFFIDNSSENSQMSELEAEEFKKHEQERLKRMSFYCFTQDCLRHYILKYFGENSAPYCGNCSNCLSNFEKVDVTVSAQKIISCIKRMNENFGTKMVIDVLRGSSQQKIKNFHLDQLSTYGLMKDTSEKQLRQMIEFLLAEGYVMTSDGQYPLLKLGFRAKELLTKDAKLMMSLAKEEKPKRQIVDEDDVQNPALFAQLQVLRRELADQQKVPAYIVFNDATLREMSAKLPQSLRELSRISGVGDVKLEKYGDAFMAIITDYQAEKIE